MEQSLKKIWIRDLIGKRIYQYETENELSDDKDFSIDLIGDLGKIKDRKNLLCKAPGQFDWTPCLIVNERNLVKM